MKSSTAACRELTSKDQKAMAELIHAPPPERSEPARLIAMLAGHNDAVKNNPGQGWRAPHDALASRRKRGMRRHLVHQKR